MPPWWFFAVAAPLAMIGAWLGGIVLDRMSDVNFLKYTRWIVTAIGVIYLIAGGASISFPDAAPGQARVRAGTQPVPAS